MTAFLAYINLPVQYLEYLITKLNEMGIEVKGIASHRSGRQRTLDKYPQLRYYSMASFNDFTTWEAPFDEGLFRQVIGPDLEEVLPISDRYPSFGNGSIESMNRVFWEFSLANKALSEVRPDLLLFFKEPESVLEYMLYKLAKHLGIKVLMTRATTFTHSRGVADNYELPLLSKDLTITPGTIDIGDKTGLHPQSENILKKVSAMESSYMPNYMKAQNIDFSFLSFLNYYSQFHNIKLLIADGLRQKQGHLYRFRLYNKYQKLVSEVIPEKNSLKIYFPLHYQPEQTTMPLGASFVNQTKSIKLLSDKLPDGAVIYVKEHISTFAKALKPNINFRPYHFYKTLASIPKVRLVSVHFPSQKLQSICDSKWLNKNELPGLSEAI